MWVHRNLEVLQKVQANDGMRSSCLKKIPRKLGGQSLSHAQSNPFVCGYLTTVGSRKIAGSSWVICCSLAWYYRIPASGIDDECNASIGVTDDLWVSFPSDDADVWNVGVAKCVPVGNSPIAVASAMSGLIAIFSVNVIDR